MRGARIGVIGLLAVAMLALPQPGQGAGADDSPTNRSGEHRVPFEARDGMIYIQARVNGSRRTLLVDTGATFTILTLKTASYQRIGAQADLAMPDPSQLPISSSFFRLN
jgi:hypothetical protein